MTTFFIKTFGCKINQYDSELLKKFLEKKGLKYSEFINADVVIVNGCSVTANSERKARQFIRKIKRKNPHSKIILTGCYAKRLFLSKESLNEGIKVLDIKDLSSLCKALNLSINKNFYPIEGLSEHTRTFIKIQEGCDNFCSYCIIPFLRGKPKSRVPADIFRELEKIQNKGIKEIVLSGIHLGKYGYDLKNENVNLSSLLKNILENFDFPRVRLSSIEPMEITDELIEIVASSDRICKHLHIPLQSGSDIILKKMNRPYTRKDYLSLINKIIKKIPDLGISTDIIVGFPGESESDFYATVDVLKQIDFVRIHIFPYSDRPFTKASKMPNKLHRDIIKKRIKVLKQHAYQSRLRFHSKFIGKKLKILIENYKNLFSYGYSDNYIHVIVEKNINPNTIIMAIAKKIVNINNDIFISCEFES